MDNVNMEEENQRVLRLVSTLVVDWLVSWLVGWLMRAKGGLVAWLVG